MIARVEEMTEVELTPLRWLVGAFIRQAPLDSWRHTGLGALQAYVREGDVEELRVHVWHPALVASGISASGDVHDHRFDLESAVLDGEVRHTEYQPELLHRTELGDHRTERSWVNVGNLVVPESLQWRVHEVTHARAALEATGSMHEAHPPDERRYAVKVEGIDVRAGQRYTFPRGEFHATKVSVPAVTLIRKLRQTSRRARVLSPVSTPVVHAFENPLPPALWRHALRHAAERLLR